MFKLFYLKIVLSIGLAVTLLLVPHSLNAEDTGEHKGQVRVGVLDIEQATSPHSRELLERHIRAYLRELSKRTHLGYEYIPVQPLEGKRMLEEGSLDLLAPVQRNDSLQPMKLYSEGYSVYGMLSLFTVPGSGLNVLDSSTMNGITIGYVTTEDNTRYIRHYVLTHGWQNINYVTYANGQNMMEALQRGEIQAAMDDGSDLLGNEIELGIIAITKCQFMALPTNQDLLWELNEAILDTELKNPSFGTMLEQTYIDPAIHSIAAYAEIENKFIETAPPIRIVLPGNYSPFVSSSGGIFGDIIENIGTDSGLKFDIIIANNSREAREMLQNGKADIMPCIYSGANYENPLNYTNNFLTVEYSAIVHKDTSFVGSPKTMVAAAKSPGLSDYLKKQFPEWDIVILETVEECLEAVENHQYTIAMIPTLYLQQHSNLITRPNLKINDKYSCHIGISLMAAESTPEMLTHVLNTAIQRLSPDEVNRIIKKNSTPVINLGFLLQEYPIHLAAAVLFTLVILLLIGFILHNNRQTRKRNIILSEKNDELERALHEVKVLTKDRDAYKQEAETDPLTGLLNKRGIALRCQELLDRQQEGESIALLIIDLDHFKRFNDTYGHQMGDELLIDFAKILKTTCTDLTAVGRFGGDEFMIMVTLPPEATVMDIRKQIQWLLTRIKDMMVDGHAANVTGSIGIAITKERGTSYDYLFREADRALYKVKDAGRDGFQIYEKK
jgi:diguanylate cyclase (GGDEF)-like protein